MNHVAFYAQWTGYTVWVAAAWAVLTKAATITDRAVAERRRRRRNTRRLSTWRPPPRRCDPGDDVTRVLPGILRPKGPR